MVRPLSRGAGPAIALAAALACGEGAPEGARPAVADVVFRNGAVYTVDAARSWARTVAVREQRIVHVGDSVPAGLIGPETEVVDLAGGMLLPGFQDGHVHLLLGGVELGGCTLFTLATAAAVVDSIAACAAAWPDGWLRGVGWELTVFPDANPSKAALDRIAPDRPALLEAADGHSAWVNSRALELAGVTRDTPDPPDGRIERDPRTGEPSGTLRESAVELISRLLPERTDSELAAGLDRVLPLAAERGLTTVMEASASESLLRAYAAADRAGRLTLRVVVAANAEPDSTGVEGVVRRLGEWRTRYATPRVLPAAAKLFEDGVIEAGTAALLAPYLDRRGDAGRPIHSQSVLDSLATALDRDGWQVHVHAIGDRAIRMTLDAFEHARSVNGARDARHTITHLQLIDPADLPRFRRLGVVANFEPFWANGDEYLTRLAEPSLGLARSRWLYPIRSVMEAGAVVSGGSDWSVSSLAPLDGIQVAVTRRPPGDHRPPWRPEEVVDLPTAIAMYTINAAWQNHLERETGSIEVGKLADLVVLERNLFEVPHGEVHAVRVMRTILEGRTVFRRR